MTIEIVLQYKGLETYLPDWAINIHHLHFVDNNLRVVKFQLCSRSGGPTYHAVDSAGSRVAERWS